MPTYNYHCDACEADFEREQRITEAPIKKCPSCGRLKARRMISSGNFILKGGGWYSDAYGLKSEKKTVSTSTDASASDGGAKSESTPKSTPAESGEAAKTGSTSSGS